MATLRLRLLGPLADELAVLLDADRAPQWALQLYRTHGAESPAQAPLSAAVHALARELEHRAKRAAAVLARVEEMGWVVEVGQHDLRIHTGLDPLTSEVRLERAGVWAAARMLAPRDERGEVLWEETGPARALDARAAIERVRAEHPDPATAMTLDLLSAELERQGDLWAALAGVRGRPLPDSGRRRLDEVARHAERAGALAGR